LQIIDKKVFVFASPELHYEHLFRYSGRDTFIDNNKKTRNKETKIRYT